MKQNIIYVNDDYSNVIDFIKKNKIKRIFLVCESFIENLKIGQIFLNMKDVNIIKFSDFHSNPTYESVMLGVSKFKEQDFDMIISIGGGSSIDVGKCIKFYADINILFTAIPTTAGSGSESTKFAVIYKDGEKKSIEDKSLLPNTVIFDSKCLDTLPYYQRCSSLLDALCHSIESFLSVNSTNESRNYSRKALKMILDNMDKYLKNDSIGNKNMLKAANIAGRAINITKTTAAHAMCYKLTSLYNISHGHSAFLCLTKLYSYMLNNLNRCIDKRGVKYLEGVFEEIKNTFKCQSQDEVIKKLENIKSLTCLNIKVKKEDYEILCKSVNKERLSNNPIRLDVEDINMIYHKILKEYEYEN